MLFMAACTAPQEPQIIAHRGFWKAEDSAQNSITSLRKAAQAGVYGSEFDVQLTADSMLVVFHDDSIAGRAIIDMTIGELGEFSLNNGEKIPTLRDYLEEGKKHPQTQLIFEMKPLRDSIAEKYAVERSVEMVRELGLTEQTEYISFSLHACEEFVRLTPESDVYYLNGELSPLELKQLGIDGMDYHYSVYQAHPKWVNEAHDLGLKVNVWTVNDNSVVNEMTGLGVDFITTDEISF